MLSTVIISFIAPVIISLIVTPWVIKFAKFIGAVDAPGARKVHTDITPRIGGLSVFISVLLSLILILAINPQFVQILLDNLEVSFIVGGGLITVFLLGFWDDMQPLKPGIKFSVQFLIAGIIYFAGFKISNISNPLGGMLNVEIIDFPLTLLWIVGITNAFNLIDGLDGLASGIATIATVSIFTVTAISGDVFTALLALIMAGALVGFLRYNFNPAKIFLGDSGSLFIGFCLALLSIQSTTKITTGFALLFPLLVLVLPITDTLVSMVRRFLGSLLPSHKVSNGSTSIIRKIHGMFVPDRSHIHHQLLSLGLSHRNTVITLYFISAFFALGAFAVTQVNSLRESLTVLFLFGIALIYGIKKLRYHEIEIFQNGLILPIFRKIFSTNTAYLMFFDLMFIVTSHIVGYLLIDNISSTNLEADINISRSFVIISSIQLFLFWTSGLYKENIKSMGIGSSIRVTSSVAHTIVFSAPILFFTVQAPVNYLTIYLIVNFYILLTLTLGFRITYQALSYSFHKAKQGKDKVLIYGANRGGSLILDQLTHLEDQDIKVLGFLDDDPNLENSNFDGYSIFGGYWVLERLIRKHTIDSIYIFEDSVMPENFKRVNKLACENGIKIKRFQFHMEELNQVERSSNSLPQTVVSHV
jgi:UDP-GlcNAc:undecaprenyl-phosphate GlcNAc-1-phosphate transferase